MRISDWSSDVCSSDLTGHRAIMKVLMKEIRHGEAFPWDHARRRGRGRPARRRAHIAAPFQSHPSEPCPADRKSDVSGKSVAVRVEHVVRRTIKTKQKQ